MQKKVQTAGRSEGRSADLARPVLPTFQKRNWQFAFLGAISWALMYFLNSDVVQDRVCGPDTAQRPPVGMVHRTVGFIGLGRCQPVHTLGAAFGEGVRGLT